MHIVTDQVYPDEPCHGLFEGPRKRFYNGRQMYRWTQQVFVVRGDSIAKHEIDLGSVDDFKDCAELMIPSFGENTVAELQDLAERSRYSDFPRRHREKVAAESTLMTDIVRQIEQRSQIIKNRTVTGPYVFNQRGGYSHEQAMRNLKDRQREYKEQHAKRS